MTQKNNFRQKGINQGIISKNKTETQQGKHQISSVCGIWDSKLNHLAPKDLGSLSRLVLSSADAASLVSGAHARPAASHGGPPMSLAFPTPRVSM